MTEQHQLKNIIEAALLVANEPLTTAQIQALFAADSAPTVADIKTALTVLAEDCGNRGIELTQVASGYRFQAKAQYAQWISQVFAEKPPRYSRAALETLTLIAYRQPITRGEIEDVRGVAVSSNIIRLLLEHEWIKVLGHRETPGRPALYGTTKQFLDHFNLQSLTDLPPLAEIVAEQKLLSDTETTDSQDTSSTVAVDVDASTVEEKEIPDAGTLQPGNNTASETAATVEPEQQTAAVNDAEEMIDSL